MQLAHLLTVPFENLSIHAGEPIVLEDDALFEKIVARRRGGFCYELNGLFAALLRASGFNVSMLSARVANGKGGFTPDFDHMPLIVSLD
ncbi:MAG: arylamine N-acetyltransferase [Candidatus Marinimicrobia bacterium]|nr:arylamine N-acetyltransferase [Candidatus Neomarinimicrobiota bacterium]